MHVLKTLTPLMSLLLAGCPPGESTKPEPTCDAPIEAAWGIKNEQGFMPFGDGDTCELTLGFQGFRYVESVAQISGTEATEALLSFRIDVDGYEPYSQRSVEDLSPGPGGVRYAEDVLVFINDIPLPQLIGRGATISLHVEAAACEANTGATVTLVDDENCIGLEDGGLECPGDVPP